LAGTPVIEGSDIIEIRNLIVENAGIYYLTLSDKDNNNLMTIPKVKTKFFTMFKKYFILSILLLMFACNKEEEMEVFSLPPLECQGTQMVGVWSMTDSIEITYLDLDSTGYEVYHNELILYEDGIGNIDLTFLSDDYFFRWTLQCEPDIFTMSIPFNNADSLFTPVELYSITPYDIIVNDLAYKKMRHERSGSINQVNQRRIKLRILTKL
jgi:hypothetical protein